jgi:hypothetical protein
MFSPPAGTTTQDPQKQPKQQKQQKSSTKSHQNRQDLVDEPSPQHKSPSSQNNTKKSPKNQLQEQFVMLLGHDDGVIQWCEYNNFDPVVVEKIGHLNGDDLLAMAKPRLMSLIGSPKHGLLVWTRLRHLVSAMGEQAIPIADLISARDINVNNGRRDDKNKIVQKNHDNYRHSHPNAYNLTQYSQYGNEVALPYHADDVADQQSYTPQFSSLLDTPIPHTQHPPHSPSPTNHNNTQTQRKTTYPSYSSPQNEFKQSYNKNNDDYDGIPNHTDNNRSNYGSYYHDIDNHSNNYHDRNKTNGSQTERIRKTGSGNFEEFLDLNSLSLPNLMNYLSWSSVSSTLNTSYNEWCNMINDKYQQNDGSNGFLEIAKRAQQMKESNGDIEESLPSESSRRIKLGSQANYGSGGVNEEYDIIQEEGMGNKNKKNTDKKKTDIKRQNGNFEPETSYQNYSYQSNAIGYDDNNNNNDPAPLNLPPSVHSQKSKPSPHSSPNHPTDWQDPKANHPDYSQCEFGVCARYTSTKCADTNCRLSLCAEHMTKDLLTGYYYCTNCYQSTYSYAMANNRITNGCNVQ